MKLLNSDIRKYETDCDISTGNLWLLLSKFSSPHPDASLYGDKFTYIGAVTSGTHPVDSNAINGWYVWATCSDSQPQDDSNGHSWISGSANDFTTFTFNRVNADPACLKKALLIKNCESPKPSESCWKYRQDIIAIDNAGMSYKTEWDIEVTWSNGDVTGFNVPIATSYATHVQSQVDGFNATDPLGNTGRFTQQNGLNIARHTQATICPGEVQPLECIAVAVSGAGTIGRKVTMKQLFIRGQENYISRCADCGSAPIWYDGNGQEIAKPDCAIPCSTDFAPDPVLPQPSCTEQVITVCDNVNSTDQNDWVSIVAIYTLCVGETPDVRYYTDSSFSTEYTPVGDIVDCATGEIAAPEPQTCSQFEALGNLYQINLDQKINFQFWRQGGNAAAHDDVSNIFTGFDQHINGVADSTGTVSSWAFSDQTLDGAGANGQDQFIAYAYIYFPQEALLRETNGNTGERMSFWVDGVKIYESPSGNDSPWDESSAGLFGDGDPARPEYKINCGIHKIGFQQSDVSAYGGVQLQWSLDDGVTWLNVPIKYTSSVKPQWSCINVIKCEDTGQLLNSLTGATVVVGEFDTFCEPCVADLPVTLSSQRLTAITTPSAPANTKEVNIYNYSSATLQFDTNLGSQLVGPNTSIEFRAGGGQNISFTGMSVLAGSWTGTSQVLINYLGE